MHRLLLGLVILGALPACEDTAQDTAQDAAPPSTQSTASAKPPAIPTARPKADLGTMTEAVRKSIPQGSGDYAEVLALTMIFKKKDMTYAEYERAIVDRQLPPHKLGDEALMRSPPTAAMMPKDWEGNWGVLAMAYFLGELTKDEYARVHAAAHPACSATK